MPLQIGPRDQSWVALLASTVGLPGVSSQRVRITGQVPSTGEVRVVVQVLGDHRRPLGATERVVAAAQLEGGLSLNVVYEDIVPAERILAWVEPNARELEFGALTATPQSALAWAEGSVDLVRTDLRLRSDVAEAA